MFEEIPFVLGFLLVSLVLSVVFFNVEYKPLKIAVQVVAIIGVVVHEISHVLICIVTNTKINSVTLLKKVENERHSNKIYGGQVNIQPDPRISFLQALVVGLAPLFVSFWIFFFLLSELSNPNIIDIIAIFYVFLMVSLLLGAAPSTGDLSQIASTFTYDTTYSIYQLLLLVISIFPADLREIIYNRILKTLKDNNFYFDNDQILKDLVSVNIPAFLRLRISLQDQNFTYPIIQYLKMLIHIIQYILEPLNRNETPSPTKISKKILSIYINTNISKDQLRKLIYQAIHLLN